MGISKVYSYTPGWNTLKPFCCGVGPNGESPFWKLRDWLLCSDNLFTSFEDKIVLDLFRPPPIAERNPLWFRFVFESFPNEPNARVVTAESDLSRFKT